MLRRILSFLFGEEPAEEQAPRRRAAPAQQPEPGLEPVSPRVLVIVYNPVVSGSGTSLIQQMGWTRVDPLIQGYISDIEECSGGWARYQVVDRQEVNEFPVKADGFRYDAKSYLDVVKGRAHPHPADVVDYHQIVRDFNLLERVGSREIDEVWLFGFPFAGFYESRMVGRGAFWCNAPPLENTESCPRRFVIMGFSYERGVGEMLEDLGHRAESVMQRVYQGVPDSANLWKQFSLYDKIAPGQAQVGMMHFAPNSQKDYDWGNRTPVPSGCDDWLQFPELAGSKRTVNCAEWGNGDIRLHHKWWFQHLPKVPGSTDGITNNWWQYFIRVDDPFFD